MSVQSVKATINGQEVVLTLNSSTGKYEATVTAPGKSSFNKDGGYYAVSITATDDAGNSTTVDATDSQLGENLRLVVKEKVAPVITITGPTGGAYLTNSKPSITWTVTDDDSGVNADSISITIDGNVITDGITKNLANGVYTCSYTPATALGDGAHTIAVNAKDNDGNSAVEKTVAFTVDTVPPALTVTNPVDGLITNAGTVTISGTTNDSTSSPVTLTINGVDVEVSSDGKFSHVFTLTEGENTITVVATDAAGKSTTVVRTVTKDSGAPVFKSVTITPNPVDAGKTYIISVSVEDI